MNDENLRIFNFYLEQIKTNTFTIESQAEFMKVLRVADSNLYTLLHHAVIEENYNAVVKLLKFGGIDPNVNTGILDSVLMLAVEGKRSGVHPEAWLETGTGETRAKIVEALIDAGANVNYGTMGGSVCAIGRALEYDDYQMISLLRKHGALWCGMRVAGFGLLSFAALRLKSYQVIDLVIMGISQDLHSIITPKKYDYSDKFVDELIAIADHHNYSQESLDICIYIMKHAFSPFKPDGNLHFGEFFAMVYMRNPTGWKTFERDVNETYGPNKLSILAFIMQDTFFPFKRDDNAGRELSLSRIKNLINDDASIDFRDKSGRNLHTIFHLSMRSSITRYNDDSDGRLFAEDSLDMLYYLISLGFQPNSTPYLRNDRPPRQSYAIDAAIKLGKDAMQKLLDNGFQPADFDYLSYCDEIDIFADAFDAYPELFSSMHDSEDLTFIDRIFNLFLRYEKLLNTNATIRMRHSINYVRMHRDKSNQMST